MIKCTVSNCSHNKSEVCYADRINIGGTCSKNVMTHAVAHF